MSKKFNYLTADRAYKEIYLQFPKAFLSSPVYRDLSDSAKIAYMVLKDKAEYSLENGWVDKNNRVYFEYKDEEFAKVINKSKKTAMKYKNELIDFNLLLKKNMGFNKQKMKQNPNRFYIADLQVSASDVYPTKKKEKSKKNAQNIDMSEGVDVTLSGTSEGVDVTRFKNSVKNAQNVDMSEGVDVTLSGTSEGVDVTGELYNIPNKDFKDNKESYDDQNSLLIHSFKKQMPKAESDLINIYIQEYNLLEKYGERIMRLVSAYSFDNFDQFVLFMSKFHYALKSAEKELNTEINIENIENKPHYQKELEITFMKTYQKHKAGEVDNLNNYLFTAIKNAYKDAYTNIQSGEYDKQENERKTSTSRNKPIRKETVPNWAKDTSAQKEADDKLVSEEKQAEFKKRLEALRKTRKNVSHNSN